MLPQIVSSRAILTGAAMNESSITPWFARESLIPCYFFLMNSWRWLPTIAAIGVAGLLVSCGQPGAPQAPSLQLPRAVEDLSATRQGDRVTLRWTAPNRFTDGRTIRRVGPTHICRTVGTAPAANCNVVGTLPAPPPKPKGKTDWADMEYQDALPPDLLRTAPGYVMYGVEVLNTHGRSVGVSTQKQVSTAPAFPPPASLSATLDDRGVTLTWLPIAVPGVPGIRFVYEIQRRAEGTDFAQLATVPISDYRYLDQTIEWEKKFDYRIAVLTESADGQRPLVQGEDSPAVNIFAHDVFPPAMPRELQAVFSGPGQQSFIDLSWAPNLEPDLAGYNIYRHEAGGPPEKVNAQLMTSPSFRDEHVISGKQYFYAVSAVDVRGNESQKSPETSEQVP